MYRILCRRIEGCECFGNVGSDTSVLPCVPIILEFDSDENPERIINLLSTPSVSKGPISITIMKPRLIPYHGESAAVSYIDKPLTITSGANNSGNPDERIFTLHFG